MSGQQLSKLEVVHRSFSWRWKCPLNALVLPYSDVPSIFVAICFPESACEGFFVKNCRTTSHLHLHIFTSAHPHSHLYLCSSSHLHSQLHIYISAHLHILTSTSLLIFIFTHLHLCSSSHPHIYISHLYLSSTSHIFTSRSS